MNIHMTQNINSFIKIAHYSQNKQNVPLNPLQVHGRGVKKFRPLYVYNSMAEEPKLLGLFVCCLTAHQHYLGH